MTRSKFSASSIPQFLNATCVAGAAMTIISLLTKM